MPRVKGEKTYREICYTINNYSDENVLNVMKINSKPTTGHVAYFEEGKSETPHIQGDIEFQNAKSMNAIKKYFNCHFMHIEERRGSSEEAWNYCKK
jgi:hypothetical protein